MKNLKNIINKNKNKYLQELKQYIAFPSISNDSKHKKDVTASAKWLADRMKKAGLKSAKLIRTQGHPIVFSEWNKNKNSPTVLIYGHYDVQPPDPLEQWESKPFELLIKKDDMYARGVCDNKAPHLSHLLGVELLLQKTGKLPVNVKFLVEGEEEIDSPSILSALKENKALFKSDIALVSDGIMLFDAPVVEYGVRGLVCFEINVKCLDKDAHSGGYGGVVDNSAMALSHIITKLKDRNGKILIPGIYPKVRKLKTDERKMLKRSDQRSSEIQEQTGARTIFGEKGFSNIERTGARPSLDVNGFWSGFTKEGTKTIIPAEASAKLSMRIVPNLDKDYVQKQITSYIRKVSPKTCKVEVKFQASADPVLFDWRDKKFNVAADVLEDVFGNKAKFKLVGGSVGAVDAMKKVLGIDSVFTGFSLPDCGMHSPNEKFKLSNFLKGIEFTVKYMEKLA